MRTIGALIIVAACLLGAQLALGELRLVKEASLHCHRLPVNVKPTKYDLHLKFPSLDSDVYEGQVDIAVGFSKMSTKKIRNWGLENVPCAQQYDENTIVLHADKSLEIKDITVTSASHSFFGPKKVQKQRDVVEVIRDEANQMIAIKLKDAIHLSKRGTPGKVSIIFKGRLRDDKRGVYLSTYNDGKQEYKHIVSQFQPTFARTAFPCFDEPRFRVPFSVRISHPKGLTAYGNTDIDETTEEGGLTSTQFSTSLAMPVHMVAFTVGRFDKPLEVFSTRSLPGKSNEKVRTIRVITAPGKQDAGNFALAVARMSLEWFEKYIDYDFPLDKLDVIAIADLARDNTESWGLVFVCDTLLWVDDETKPETKITTALNIAHAVAHQWFGNLISVNWWSDLWITEGVAAQFAFEFVEIYFGYDYYSKFQILAATRSSVLQADQTGNLHPLSPLEENLRTSEQIDVIFDKLEFMKSASMADMVKDAIRYKGYKDMLIKLIEEHAYKTISFEDYQRAVLSSDGKVTAKYLPDLLETFPKYTGVPVVNCRFSSYIRNTLKLHLEPFDKARDDIEGELFYPLRKVAIKAEAVFSGGDERIIQHKIIITQEIDINAEFWVPYSYRETNRAGDNFIKIGYNLPLSNYYRTRYTDELYNRIQGAIKNQRMQPSDRFQILNDAISFVQAGLITTQRFKSLLNSYANEDDPIVVPAILIATNTFSTLEPEEVNSLESDKAVLSIFKDYGFEVSGNENVIMQRAREVVLTSLIQQGNKQVVDAALEAFDQAHGKVALFLRQPVYTAVALSGSSDQVNQLLSHLTETKSYEEQIRLVAALTLSKDKEVLTKVKSWLGSSGLKAETTRPFLDTISAALSH